MKSDNFVVVQGWMCNELGLKSNELLVFALIYGFSQDGVSQFKGGRNYIAETFNITLPTVDKALQSLVEREYIIKQESGDFIHADGYYVNEGVVKKLYGGGKETLPSNNKKKDINSNSKELLLQKSDFLRHEKPAKQSLYSKCIALIQAKTESEKERQLLTDWLKMLLEKYNGRGKTLYANIFKGKLNTLDKYDRKDWAEIIEYNLQRGYEAFYPISISQWNNTDKPWDAGVTSIEYSEEEKKDMEAWQAEMRKKGIRVDF